MAFTLSFKAITWYKDSHSLFDYESNKITENNFDIALPENHIGIFRKKNSTSISITNKLETVDMELFDLLSYIKLKNSENPNNYRLEFSDSRDFKKKNKKKNERVNTDESNSSSESKEEAYVVVSKLKDPNGIMTGCKLSKFNYYLDVGHVVKLGRVEYFVSEIFFRGKKFSATSKSKFTTCNRNIMKFSPETLQKEKEGNNCKICLDETETSENFLFNPCKCAGSCGTVHIECLQHWIQIKVKKETIGGTTHFNFEKFECEICKSELPMIIETNNGQIELLPIQKPKANYMILEAACEKTKSVMLIQNPTQEGIKLGRGHDCEIRITDISVSRNHANIKENPDGFYIYDNKSKFGTLVKDENSFDLEVGNIERGIQIGRTLVLMQMKQIRPLNSRY